jgi:drug/metabolite transporter (DMT)-like permease
MATNDSTHRAGLFDIRTIIGLLLAIYGVILVATSFFTSEEQLAKTDGVDLNLWTGIGMVVAAAAFLGWARLRPIVVKDDPDAG